MQIQRRTTYFVSIGYRHCSELGRAVLNTYASAAVQTSLRTAVQFSSCAAMNEPLEHRRQRLWNIGGVAGRNQAP